MFDAIHMKNTAVSQKYGGIFLPKQLTFYPFTWYNYMR